MGSGAPERLILASTELPATARAPALTVTLTATGPSRGTIPLLMIDDYPCVVRTSGALGQQGPSHYRESTFSGLVKFHEVICRLRQQRSAP